MKATFINFAHIRRKIRINVQLFLNFFKTTMNNSDQVTNFLPSIQFWAKFNDDLKTCGKNPSPIRKIKTFFFAFSLIFMIKILKQKQIFWFLTVLKGWWLDTMGFLTPKLWNICYQKIGLTVFFIFKSQKCIINIFKKMYANLAIYKNIKFLWIKKCSFIVQDLLGHIKKILKSITTN